VLVRVGVLSLALGEAGVVILIVKPIRKASLEVRHNPPDLDSSKAPH
jgi:hypothetical protein